MVTRARDAASAHVAGGGGTTALDADADDIVDDDARRRVGRLGTTRWTTGDDARAPCVDGEDDAGVIAPRCARDRDRARWTREWPSAPITFTTPYFVHHCHSREYHEDGVYHVCIRNGRGIVV